MNNLPECCYEYRHDSNENYEIQRDEDREDDEE